MSQDKYRLEGEYGYSFDDIKAILEAHNDCHLKGNTLKVCKDQSSELEYRVEIEDFNIDLLQKRATGGLFFSISKTQESLKEKRNLIGMKKKAELEKDSSTIINLVLTNNTFYRSYHIIPGELLFIEQGQLVKDYDTHGHYRAELMKAILDYNLFFRPDFFDKLLQPIEKKMMAYYNAKMNFMEKFIEDSKKR